MQRRFRLYSVSELAINTIQHAKAPGFAMAQYTAQTDLIRAAIADKGIGVWTSFDRIAERVYVADFNRKIRYDDFDTGLRLETIYHARRTLDG